MVSPTERRRTILRRERRYPARLSVAVSEETKAALDAASERYGIAAGVLARWAIEAGLPSVRDRERKRKRNSERNGG